MDPKTHDALESGQESVPTLLNYTITGDDIRGPFAPVPAGLIEQAKLPSLNYQSPVEEIGEKFHTSRSFWSG